VVLDLDRIKMSIIIFLLAPIVCEHFNKPKSRGYGVVKWKNSGMLHGSIETYASSKKPFTKFKELGLYLYVLLRQYLNSFLPR
jgi:CRISPR/Cas system CSM-associated protein Csm3 (group 7 of RAMP superfamily)